MQTLRFRPSTLAVRAAANERATPRAPARRALLAAAPALLLVARPGEWVWMWERGERNARLYTKGGRGGGLKGAGGELRSRTDFAADGERARVAARVCVGPQCARRLAARFAGGWPR